MQENLQHKLKNRHIQMIAIGGAIGTGFFLGSSDAISMTGASITIAYIIGGIIMYGIMRALGEMTVDYPTSGSFVEYAKRYLGNTVGFMTGWNAWTLFTISCMLEVTAVSTLLDHWIFIPHWITCLVLLVTFGGINLLGVKYFGEAEFWFACIKVAVIIFMIISGTYLIFFNHHVHNITINNIESYKNANVLFSHGIYGFLQAMVFVCLSFCGSEFVSIAAGEAENPQKSIPKAINGVIFRILLFYVLTLLVIVLIYPTDKLTKHSNPFVDVFSQLGFERSADIINFVAITAALSALNSCMYVASRFLYNLSLNQQAPKAFAKVNKSKLPQNALFFTFIVSFIAVIANYTFPENILAYLFSMLTVAIIINWLVIMASHFSFRVKLKKLKSKSIYSMPGFPIVNIIIFISLIVILAIMTTTAELRLGIYVAAAWLLLLITIYFIKNVIWKK